MKRGDMPANPTGDTTYPDGQVQIGDTGMTVREKFVMAAMTGLLSNPSIADQSNEEVHVWIAARAREQADAQLAELKRTGGGHE